MMTYSEIKKTPKLISFGLLFAGMLFICIPGINLFDIMADFVGYFLLLLAVRNASECFPHFDDALRRFRILFWINLAKLPAIILMLRVAGINMDERGMISVFALSFAVVEWIFVIPAFRALFEGFIYLGEREGVSSAISVRGNAKRFDTLPTLTTIFLLVKGAASFLPETVFLSTFFYNGSLDPRSVHPATFYPLLAAFAFLVALVFGLILLFHIRPYFSGMKADGAMSALLDQKATTLSQTLLAARERLRVNIFFALAILGFAFAIDLPFENADFLPDYIAAIAFFALFFLAPKSKHALYGKFFSVCYFATAIARTVFSSLFFADFTYTDIAYRDAALVRYLPVMITFMVEAVFFFLTVLMLLSLLRDFIVEKTGKSLLPKDTVIRNEVHATLFQKVKALGALALLNAAVRPITAYLMTITERHIITAEEANQYYSAGAAVDSPKYAWLWILVFVIGAAGAVYAYVLSRAIKIEAGLLEEDE